MSWYEIPLIPTSDSVVGNWKKKSTCPHQERQLVGTSGIAPLSLMNYGHVYSKSLGSKIIHVYFVVYFTCFVYYTIF